MEQEISTISSQSKSLQALPKRKTRYSEVTSNIPLVSRLYCNLCTNSNKDKKMEDNQHEENALTDDIPFCDIIPSLELTLNRKIPEEIKTKFSDNWIDTIGKARSLSDVDWGQLGLPVALVNEIKNKISIKREIDILHSLLNSTKFARSNFKLPRTTLFLTGDCFGYPYGRVEALQITLQAIHFRWNIYRKNPDLPLKYLESDAEKRNYSRLIGVLSSPGSGKTYFLDTLAHLEKKLKSDDLEKLFENIPKEDVVDFQNWLKTVIFLPVSFNGFTSISPTEDTQIVVLELVTRLLYSYIFDSMEQDFMAFREIVMQFFRSNSDIKEPILFVQRLISENEIKNGNKKPCFFLLLDELSKIDPPKHSDEEKRGIKEMSLSLLSKVSLMLDYSTYGQWDLLVTSLDRTTLANSIKTASGRSLQWVPIRPPGFELARRLFEDTLKNIDPNYSFQFEVLLYLSSYHWRSLETIKKSIDDLKGKNFSDMVDIIIDKSPPKSNILRGRNAENYILDSLNPIPIALDTELLSNELFEIAISKGIFVNTIARTDDTEIPILSCMMIEQWSRTRNEAQKTHFSRLLNKLFEIDRQGPDAYTFEKFHAIWEAIKCYSIVQYENVKSRSDHEEILVSLKDFYRGQGQYSELSKTKFYVRRSMSLCYEYETVSPILDLLKTKREETLSKVFHLGSKNPGFDSMSFHETQDRKYVIIRLISSKFSSINTFQEITELNKGRKNAIALFPPDMQDKIFFIANCWRKGRKYNEIPKNTMILTEDHLSILYGPFNQRPQVQYHYPKKVIGVANQRE